MITHEARAPRRRSLFASPGVWFGLTVSAACLWLAFRHVPFAELGASLSQADYLWLIPAIGLHLAAIWARAGSALPPRQASPARSCR